MEILRFTLSGKHAFFKKPDVNSYVYFTYGNIHKVALLGIFGAILGYGGYTQQKGYHNLKKKEKLLENYPEFYEKLHDLKISIIPCEKHTNGIIPKKIQAFNNSVGYASKEQGGNLIVKEQWLEDPSWEVCVMLDCEEAQKIKEYICNHKCVFIPYLGKNDHIADISKVSIENGVEVAEKIGKLACLSPTDEVKTVDLDEDDIDETDAVGSFQYKEMLPYALDGITNQYIFKTMLYTDIFVEVGNSTIYKLSDGKKIIFY